jgi:YVTN family beta-propeller protein
MTSFFSSASFRFSWRPLRPSFAHFAVKIFEIYLTNSKALTAKKIELARYPFSAGSLLATSSRIVVGIILLCVPASLIATAAYALDGDAQLPTGRLITSAAIASNPKTQKVYAVNEAAQSVTVVNAKTGTNLIVQVGENPIALAVNRRTNRIYVVNGEGSSVSVIDGKTDKVIATVPVDKTPYTLAVNEVTNKIYITHTYSDALTVIDGATNVPSTIKTGSADGVAIDTRTNQIFLMGYENPKIRIVNGDDGTITTVTVGPRSWGMLFDDETGTLYLAHTGTGEVAALDEKTLAVSKIPVGKIPCSIAINPKTRRLYVVNYGDETLSVIDLNSKSAIATLPVGKHPQDVAVDVARNRVLVADVHGNDVTVVDGSRNVVVGKAEAGSHPYAIAIDPRSGKAFVANYETPWITTVPLEK